MRNAAIAFFSGNIQTIFFSSAAQYKLFPDVFFAQEKTVHEALKSKFIFHFPFFSQHAPETF